MSVQKSERLAPGWVETCFLVIKFITQMIEREHIFCFLRMFYCVSIREDDWSITVASLGRTRGRTSSFLSEFRLFKSNLSAAV